MIVPFYRKNFRAGMPINALFPSFALVKDGWNDYGYYILYDLIYFEDRYNETSIGNVKILEKGSDSSFIPETFEMLPEQFCSLGQSLEYYEKVKLLFPDSYEVILKSLRDVAFFEDIAEDFSNEDAYSKGLMRFSSAEKAFAEARKLLVDNIKSVNENLYFTYSVKVDGANSPHEVYFDFKNLEQLPYRINVLIGKNGTGKTQFLGGMVNSISGLKHQNSFSPFNPLFRKVIAVSYSLFDDFPKPEETTVFSYKYIGIRANKEEIVSDEKLGQKLQKALFKIFFSDKEEIWFNAINRIIPLENLGLNSVKDITETWITNLSYENAKRLSSGQSITLFILSELIAEIVEESFVLFDEPETHLHPSAISQLMNVFYDILEVYKSYAIISTHSPIIVQDIPSKYITIFDRQGNSPIIRKLPLESFGENISTLTSKIFETIDVKELYKKYLETLSFYPLTTIESYFENELSINAQLYIAALQKKNER